MLSQIRKRTLMKLFGIVVIGCSMYAYGESQPLLACSNCIGCPTGCGSYNTCIQGTCGVPGNPNTDCSWTCAWNEGAGACVPTNVVCSGCRNCYATCSC